MTTPKISNPKSSPKISPKISLCVIVKDEQDVLPRMLASVRGLVDEIIVVDTGSTDRTPKIALSAGAKVISEPFQDDFSAVRNRSIQEASGDWILVLDADEFLGTGAREAIRAAVEDETRCGYYLQFDNQLGGGRSHRCGILRLFRRVEGVGFDYLIHEQVVPSLARYSARSGQGVAPLPAAIVHHDGYMEARYEAKGKAERNRRLFRRQIERYPDHIYSWYKYGDFLRRFDAESDRKEADVALQKAAQLLRAADPTEARRLSFSNEVFALLAVDADKRGDSADALKLAKEGLERFGASPNLLFVLGHLLAKFGHHRDSLRVHARLRQFDGKMVPIPAEPGVTGTTAFLGMGRALLNLQHAGAARRCFELSVREEPGAVEPRLALARMALDRGDAGMAQDLYEEVVAIDPRHVGGHLRLATLRMMLGDPHGAQENLLAALDLEADPRLVGPMLGQARLASGDLDGAYRVFAETPDQPEARLGMRVLAAIASGKDPLVEVRGPTAALWTSLMRQSGVMTVKA